MYKNIPLQIINESMRHFVLLILIYTSATHEEELCGSLNGKTAYLQLGERGNISHNYEAGFNTGNYTTCGVELVTCPACIINISFGHFNLSSDCDIDANDSYDECPCEFIRIWEPIRPMQSVKKICNSTPRDFVSLTRTVRILLQLHNSQNASFMMFYSAERNRNFLTGKVGDTGQFNSPYFPNFYPQDIGQEHLFSCESANCKIIIEFSDFLLAASSIIEFFDWDGQRINIFSGITFRPPIVMSTGPSLLIKFYGNGGMSYGYSGFYSFINASEYVNISNTECGGEVTDFGGVIMMKNLNGYYNCYWIIRPLNIVPTIKTHIYLKMISASFDGIIEIKSGIISNSETLESIASNQQSKYDFKEHIIALNIGFYISMEGKMDSTSRIVIVYTVFNYMDCIPGSDLMCNNKRCIPVQLSCDGFDNCGDNSDESANCDSELLIPIDYQRYLFPKTQLYTDIRGATQVFIISCILLLVIVFSLMVALCRIGVHTRNRHELSSHVRTISQLLHVNQIEDIDDPPVYEPPPEYSQVVKPPRSHRKHSKQRAETKNDPSYKKRRLSENNVESTTGWKYAAPECNRTSNEENTSISTRTQVNGTFQQFAINNFDFNDKNLDFPLFPPSTQGGINELISPSQNRQTGQRISDTKLIPLKMHLFKKNDANSSPLLESFNLEQQKDKRSMHLVRSQSYEDCLWNSKERPFKKINFESDGNFPSDAIFEASTAMIDIKKLFHQPVKSVSFKCGHNQRTLSDDTVSVPPSNSYAGKTGDCFFAEI